MNVRTKVKKLVSLFVLVAMLVASLPVTVVKTEAATVNQNQANMVARCNYMYNSTWVCQKTITSWKSQSYFNAGSTYRIPYAWPVTTGKWVGDTSYGISVDTFLAATKNASSDFYTKQSYCSSNAGSYAPYYGNDCSTFVTYCWGLSSRRTTSTLAGVSTLIGNVTSANVNSSLQIGDALNYAGSHVVFVSNITYTNGAVSAIEITEQTPPQLKRTNHTVSSLVSKYGAKYKIYRYSGTVSAPPSGAGTVVSGNNPDSYTVPTSALTTGASGNGVRWVQSVLSQLGYNLTVDGAYGSGTATQVAYFQQDYGLTVSGTADTATIAKLQTLWADKNGYYTTTASSLNMRSGDGTSYGIITSIPQNSSVAVVGFNSAGTWANIIYNGTEGWVNKSYLSFVRKFNYTGNYVTNISATITPVSFKHDKVLTVAAAPQNPTGESLRGWQLLRGSDWVWYNGSSWTADQGSSKLYQPGDKITFSSSMLNPKTGDDSFYLCAVWGTTSAPAVTAVTPSDVNPSKYGWQWTAGEAYGFMGYYGGNEQDIELCVDMCFLPSDSTPSAAFYTNGTDKMIVIDPTAVTIGATSVAYDWGDLSLNNWHDVKFKVLNNMAYVFIDGKLIASDVGYTANESYQLLFSLTGEMAIDNAMLYRSDGHAFFNIDFENEADANKIMSEGLGKRTLIFPDTSNFTVSVSPQSSQITGTGDSTFTATPSAGEGHTYSWSCSDPTLAAYLKNATNKTCTIDVTNELSKSITATLTCTVTSDGGVTSKGTAEITYIPYPAPAVSGVSPTSSSITGTGSTSYSVTATGSGLTYKWTSSNSALALYLSGIDTQTLTISIPAELQSALFSTLTCTVTNSYGKSATASSSFNYYTTPVPTITNITPASGAIEDTGSVSYTVSAQGDGLTYQWTTDSEELSALLSGTDTATVTVDVTNKLVASFGADLTCTVTNSYGKTATRTVSFSYTATEDGEMEVVMVGDVNGDGKINGIDANNLKRVFNGSAALTAAQKMAADLNGDGMVNGLDANFLSRLLIGG